MCALFGHFVWSCGQLKDSHHGKINNITNAIHPRAAEANVLCGEFQMNLKMSPLHDDFKDYNIYNLVGDPMRKKRKRKSNAGTRYRRECEPVGLMLITVIHDAT